MKSLRKRVFEYLDLNQVPIQKCYKQFSNANKRVVEQYYYQHLRLNKPNISANIKTPTLTELINLLYIDLIQERDRRTRKEIVSEIRQLLKEKGQTPDKDLTILEELELWKQKKSS